MLTTLLDVARKSRKKSCFHSFKLVSLLLPPLYITLPPYKQSVFRSRHLLHPPGGGWTSGQHQEERQPCGQQPRIHHGGPVGDRGCPQSQSLWPWPVRRPDFWDVWLHCGHKRCRCVWEWTQGRDPVLWNGLLFALIVLPFYPASFLFFLSILKLSIFRCGYHCSPGLAVNCFIIDTPTIVLSFPGSPCLILS